MGSCRNALTGLALFATVFCFLDVTPARAARTEAAIGFGTSLFSGKDNDSLTPKRAYHIGFSGNIVYRGGFNLVNQFLLGFLANGQDFAGQLGGYNAYMGTYELGGKFNFTSSTVQPYIEAGPLLSLIAVKLTSPPVGQSENQTAIKYGYTAGIGVDYIKGGQRGEAGGVGMSLKYFHYLSSPASFEFTSGKLGATGMMAELRILFGATK